MTPAAVVDAVPYALGFGLVLGCVLLVLGAWGGTR